MSIEDLVTRLRGVLDEDERVAKAATPGPWWHNPGKQWLGPDEFERYDTRKGEEFVGYGGPSPFTGCVAATGPANHPQSMADAEHIARHDPARVLRKVQAAREILDLWERANAKRHDNAEDEGRAWLMDEVVEALAIGYADPIGGR